MTKPLEPVSPEEWLRLKGLDPDGIKTMCPSAGSLVSRWVPDILYSEIRAGRSGMLAVACHELALAFMQAANRILYWAAPPVEQPKPEAVSR